MVQDTHTHKAVMILQSENICSIRVVYAPTTSNRFNYYLSVPSIRKIQILREEPPSQVSINVLKLIPFN